MERGRSPELNARQRKHVYMHSTIFDKEGPTTKSVYAPRRQQDIHDAIEGNLKRNNQAPPDFKIPRPADMQCTQNAGHGVVLPSELAHHQPPEGIAPRSTNDEVFVQDRDAIKVVQANSRDAAIPREFWQTSVNLQWHDRRNELSRQKQGRGQGDPQKPSPSAQELKLQDLSSEVFGKERLTEKSTHAPRTELLAETAHIMSTDSQLERSVQNQPSRRNEGGGYPKTAAAHAQHRLHNNLRGSANNTMAGSGEVIERESLPVPMQDEDPAVAGRRRQEKNFSDLFGSKMAERTQVRGNREELIGTQACSFLDTRSEIATRNKNGWRREEDQPVDRTEMQRQSHVFHENEDQGREYGRGMRTQTDRQERACHESKGIMDCASEIARRRRMKEPHGTTTENSMSALTRKNEDLASEQLRTGIGAPPAQFASSPRSANRASCRAHFVPRGDVTAKDTKLASLQSSIFG